MAAADKLHLLSLSEVAQKIRSGEVSSADLTRTMIDRIRSCDPDYKAYAQVTKAQAISAAIEADAEIKAGVYKGPLHGVPIAIKDILEFKGSRTEVGSKIRSGHISSQTATVVEKLRAAGAVILGKLNMTEFALSGYHPDKDVPINPWNKDYWSGVSSSGSGVAASACLAFGTLGTDTGGSIRFPSAANGVVGIKPTYGAVSCSGAFPLAWSLDHIGPITRSVEDAAIMLQAIVGHDPKDEHSVAVKDFDCLSAMKDGVKGLRIGVDEAYISIEGVHPDIIASVNQMVEVLKSLGAEIIPVDMAQLATLGEIWGGIVAYEAAKTHADTYPSRKDEYGPVFDGLLEAGQGLTDDDYAQMQQGVALAKQIMEKALSDVDMVICPGSPVLTGTTAELGPQDILPPEVVAFFVMYAAPFNYSGSPSITVPCGFDSNDMPLGVQFIGHHFGESKIIQAAYAYEQATEWHKKFPPGLAD